jgi:propanediol dehydratase small subunit
MENVESGVLSAEDIQIDAQTLLGQAKIARREGLLQLAANLTRAAELTAVPNETLLEMYEMLRPGRSSFEKLMALATTLEEQFNAGENARFVREAAAVYRARGLLRRES